MIIAATQRSLMVIFLYLNKNVKIIYKNTLMFENSTDVHK